MNQLVVPANVPIHFSLTSASVMNTFFIPQLGSMIYTMNGMTTQLNLLADKPARSAACPAITAAMGFRTCNFEVRAVSPEDFTKWVDATSNAGPVLDSDVMPISPSRA